MSDQDIYNLARFREAQANRAFERAFEETASSMKQGHWMWFIFPQLAGLGHSEIARYYGISGIEEARAYLVDEILGPRLRQICAALLNQPERDPVEIFGPVDALKLRSCMTLFGQIEPYGLFTEVLKEFYGGKRDEATLELLTCGNYGEAG